MTTAIVIAASIVAGTLLGVAAVYLTLGLDDGRHFDMDW